MRKEKEKKNETGKSINGRTKKKMNKYIQHSGKAPLII
jgi:hypothetical protein